MLLLIYERFYDKEAAVLTQIQHFLKNITDNAETASFQAQSRQNAQSSALKPPKSLFYSCVHPLVVCFVIKSPVDYFSFSLKSL